MINKNFSILLLASFYCTTLHAKNSITYKNTKGRLGDQLIIYAQTLWFANGLNFFYKPFYHSENFKLHSAHNFFYDKKEESNFDKIIYLDKETSIENETHESILYINTLNTKKSPFHNLDSIQTIALEHPCFKKTLQEHFTPIIPIRELTIPSEYITNEYISVAIHVRTGSGTDKGCTSKQLFNTLEFYNKPETIIDKSNLKALSSDERYPNKFPPYQFYIDQINLLTMLFPDKKFFIYIFTDHKNPLFIVNLFSKNVESKKQCIFKTHSAELQKTVSAEDDFYGMAQFDFLIRAGSNLSRAVQLFGKFKCVIYIKKARWHENAVVPDSIGIILYNEINDSFKEITIPTKDMYNRSVIGSIKKIFIDLGLSILC